MIRTQVSLTDEQMTGLRRLAAERGVSIAAAVRDAVDDALVRTDRSARRARAQEAIARLSTGGGPADLAEAHDRYLEDSADE